MRDYVEALDQLSSELRVPMPQFTDALEHHPRKEFGVTRQDLASLEQIFRELAEVQKHTDQALTAVTESRCTDRCRRPTGRGQIGILPD